MRIPEVGPKTVKLLFDTLGIATVDDLFELLAGDIIFVREVLDRLDLTGNGRLLRLLEERLLLRLLKLILNDAVESFVLSFQRGQIKRPEISAGNAFRPRKLQLFRRKGVPTVALLSELGPRTPETLLVLGTSGVQPSPMLIGSSGTKGSAAA